MQDDAPGDGTSLRVGSAARLIAEALGALLGLVTGLMTARALGPDGKGILSTLSYLAVIVASVAALGLGEAGLTAAARGTRSLQRVVSASLGALFVSSVVGVGFFLVLAATQFLDGWNTLLTTLAAIAATVPLVAATGVLTLFADARQRFLHTAAARLGISVVTAGATFVLVIVMRKDLNGAAVAFFAGWAAGGVLTLYAVRAAGFSLRPSLDLPYLRQTFRLGLSIQVAQVLTVLVARIDLVMVKALAGILPAGRYSVALTVGVLATYGPFILATSTYPRLASLDEEGFATFVPWLSRMAVLGGVGTAVVLGASLPVIVPLLFGDDFSGAVAPAEALLAGGVLWSVQWVLCRARAARGDGSLLVRSFGTSVAATVLLDLLLVPPLGILGAGVASALASAAGLAVAVVSFGRRERLGWQELLVPSTADVKDLARLIRSAGRLAMNPAAGG